MRLPERRPRLHPGAAVPLLRDGHRQPRLHHARRDDGDPGGRLRAAAPSSRPSPEERCTSLYGVPTMFIAELEHPRFGELRPRQPAHRDHGRLAVPDRGDEAGDRATCTRRGDDRLRHDRDVAGVDVRRADDDSLERRVADRRRVHPARRGQDRSTRSPARPCRAAQPGELCTRGYVVMRGLLERPRAHRRGGRRRTAGCTPATSRRWTTRATSTSSAASKDMVIRGGENIYPREIEEFLHTHPDVLEAAGDRRARRAHTARS